MAWRRMIPGVAVAACCALLAVCRPAPTGSRVLIGYSLIEPSMDGHRAICALIDPSSPPGATVFAGGQTVLAEGESATIFLEAETGGEWQGEIGQTYSIDLWIDMDDSYGNPDWDSPESGVDLETDPSPLQLPLEAIEDYAAFVINRPFVPAQ